MKSALLRFAVGAMTLVALHAASASALEDVASAPAFAANDAVPDCDTDGIGVAYSTEYDTSVSAYVVTSVAMTGLGSTCVGSRAAVTLLDINDNAVGSGSTDVTGGVVAALLSPRPQAEAVAGMSVVIGS